MSITVANMVAQWGNDLTQFKLGMNEVDTRINVATIRARNAATTVEAYQQKANAVVAAAQQKAARQLRDAAILQRNIGLSWVDLPALQHEAEEAERILDTVRARMGVARATAIAEARNATEEERVIITRNLNQIRKEVADAEAAYNRASKNLRAGQYREISNEQKITRIERLREDAATGPQRAQEAASLLRQRSMEVDELAAAQFAFAEAHAARLAQNAREHQIRAISNVAGGAEMAGAVTIAALGEAASIGSKYNKELKDAEHNTTLVGEAAKELKKTVDRLGKESGNDLGDLAEGFRHVANFGFNAKDSAQILEEALHNSVGTGAKAADTAQMLGKSLKEFGLQASQAGAAMNIMHQAAATSDMTLEEYVHAAGQAFAATAGLGSSFIEVNAIMSTFAEHGLSAAQAGTQLRNILVGIDSPSKKVQAALTDLSKKSGVKELATDFSYFSRQSKGIVGVFDDIKKAADGMHMSVGAVTEQLFPNLRATVGSVILSGQGFDDFHKKLHDLTELVQSGADPVTRQYNESIALLDAQVGRLKNSLTILAGDIATAVTPSITQAVSRVQDSLKWWSDLDEKTKANIVSWTALTATGLIVFGLFGKLVVGINAVRTAMVELGVITETFTIASLGPWGLAIAAVAATIAGLVWWVNKANTAEQDAIDKQLALTKTGEEHAQQVSKLVGEYERHARIQHVLIDHSKLWNIEAVSMQDILNQISILSPDLISGYTAQGNAIGFMGNAAETATKQLHDMANAQKDAQIAALRLKKHQEEEAIKTTPMPSMYNWSPSGKGSYIAPSARPLNKDYQQQLGQYYATIAQHNRNADNISDQIIKLIGEDATDVNMNSPSIKMGIAGLTGQAANPFDAQKFGIKPPKEHKEKKTQLNELEQAVRSMSEAQFKLTLAQQVGEHETNLLNVKWIESTDTVGKFSLALRAHAEALATALDKQQELKSANESFAKVAGDLAEQYYIGVNATEQQRLQYRLMYGDLKTLNAGQKLSIQMWAQEVQAQKDVAASAKQMHDIMQAVNEPLQKSESYLTTVLHKITESKEAYKQLGMWGAINLALLAQKNKDYAESQKARDSATEGAMEAIRGLQMEQKLELATTAQEKLQIKLTSDEYKNLNPVLRALWLHYANIVDKIKEKNEYDKQRKQLTDDLADSTQELKNEGIDTTDVYARWQAYLAQIVQKHKELFAEAAKRPGQTAELEDEARKTFFLNEEIARGNLLHMQMREFQKKVSDGISSLTEKYVDFGHGLRVTKKAWDELSDKQRTDTKQLVKFLDIREAARQVAGGMEDVFYRSLNNIREHGFRRFFKDIIGMFDDMLFQIAAKWLANQFIRLIVGAVGGSNAVDQLLGGARALGGPVDPGRAYLVGENGPELFSPATRGAITPNSELGGGIIVHMTVVTQDAHSFNRSEQQITAQVGRMISIAKARNA